MIIEVTLTAMSATDSVISQQTHVVISFLLVSPPMLFFNYKLLLVVRRNRRGNRESPEMKKSFSFKNISSCLLAVACYVMLSIPTFVYIGLYMNHRDMTFTLDSSTLAGFWATTIATMNPTLNCLIFFWKNKVLRTEGLKTLKSMKIGRWVQTQPSE
jgi:hypothetical protein